MRITVVGDRITLAAFRTKNAASAIVYSAFSVVLVISVIWGSGLIGDPGSSPTYPDRILAVNMQK